MHIKHRSYFKNPELDIPWFENWVKQLEGLNQKSYRSIRLDTVLGKTHIWESHTGGSGQEALVIFPGARTTGLFWDFDNGLQHLQCPLRIFIVETNGLPNLSDGNTPDIRSLDYGTWASQILEKLGLEKAWVAGASFGGLICMKLAITNPEKVKAVFLLNPGCLQPFSLNLKNLYYNLLPIISPSEKHVTAFLDQAIFCKPNHQLSKPAEKLLNQYELFAITRYKDHTQKPYYMNEQLGAVKAATYLLEGNRDLLFPPARSVRNARAKLSTLKDVVIFDEVGHGIETYPKAMNYMGQIISTLSHGI